MNKILLLGSNGMLGKTIYDNLNYLKNCEVYGIDKLDNIYFQKNYKQLDLLNLGEFTQYMNILQPDIIINAVAIVNLKFCEENKLLTNKIHIDLNQAITEYVLKNGKKSIYISTDSVFDGIKGNYNEKDSVNPLNYYAKTKLEGEKEILKDKNSIVLRTNIYGFSENQESFFKWGYNSLKNSNEITGYDDVYFNPVSVEQLAEFINFILLKKDVCGIINVGSKEKISKYEFLEKIAKIIGKNIFLKKGYLGLQKDLLIKRPKNTTLNVELLKKKYGKEYSIDEGILQIVDVIKNV